MTGFESWTTGVGSDCSANWATTTPLVKEMLPSITRSGQAVYSNSQQTNLRSFRR